MSLPLLRRTALLPGESLPSLLERLTQLNYYKKSTVIEWICQNRAGKRASKDNIMRPKFAHTFLQLSQLSRIDPEKLFAASDHYFASVLAPPGQAKEFMSWPNGKRTRMITAAVLRRSTRSASRAQFCPQCLKNAAYHRRAWIPVASSVCLKHKSLLVNRCQKCGKNISIAEIVNRQCKECKFNLRQAMAISVADDDHGIQSQRTIQCFLAKNPLSSLPFGHTFPDCPKSKLYHLFDKIILCLLVCKKEWGDLPAFPALSEKIQENCNPQTKMAPEIVYHLYRVAFTGVLNWPQGFYSLIDGCTIQKYVKMVSYDRLELLEYELLRHFSLPQLEFVLQAAVEYSQIRGIPISDAFVQSFQNIPWFIERVGLWTERPTARYLGVPEQFLSLYFPDSELGISWVQDRYGLPLFKREKVIEYKTKDCWKWKEKKHSQSL